MFRWFYSHNEKLKWKQENGDLDGNQFTFEHLFLFVFVSHFRMNDDKNEHRMKESVRAEMKSMNRQVDSHLFAHQTLFPTLRGRMCNKNAKLCAWQFVSHNPWIKHTAKNQSFEEWCAKIELIQELNTISVILNESASTKARTIERISKEKRVEELKREVCGCLWP